MGIMFRIFLGEIDVVYKVLFYCQSSPKSFDSIKFISNLIDVKQYHPSIHQLPMKKSTSDPELEPFWCEVWSLERSSKLKWDLLFLKLKVAATSVMSLVAVETVAVYKYIYQSILHHIWIQRSKYKSNYTLCSIVPIKGRFSWWRMSLPFPSISLPIPCGKKPKTRTPESCTFVVNIKWPWNDTHDKQWTIVVQGKIEWLNLDPLLFEAYRMPSASSDRACMFHFLWPGPHHLHLWSLPWSGPWWVDQALKWMLSPVVCFRNTEIVWG